MAVTQRKRDEGGLNKDNDTINYKNKQVFITIYFIIYDIEPIVQISKHFFWIICSKLTYIIKITKETYSDRETILRMIWEQKDRDDVVSENISFVIEKEAKTWEWKESK